MNLVLIPSDYEAAPLVKRLSQRARKRLPSGCVLHTGFIGQTPVCVAVVGMGARARDRAASAMDAVPAQRAILAGFCGALAETLDVGDIFLTTDPAPGAPPPWPPIRLHTAAAVVASAEDRRRLREQARADCVDMEQAHVAAEALARGIPFVGVRIVSDTPATDVPHRALEKSYDWARAKPTVLRMAAYLASHPGDIPKLVAFLRPLDAVRQKLARELADYLTA